MYHRMVGKHAQECGTIPAFGRKYLGKPATVPYSFGPDEDHKSGYYLIRNNAGSHSTTTSLIDVEIKSNKHKTSVIRNVSGCH